MSQYMSLKLLNDSPYKAIKQRTVCAEAGLHGVQHAHALSNTGRNPSAALHQAPSIPGTG